MQIGLSLTIQGVHLEKEAIDFDAHDALNYRDARFEIRYRVRPTREYSNTIFCASVNIKVKPLSLSQA